MLRGNPGGLWRGKNIKYLFWRKVGSFSVKDQTVNILDFEGHTTLVTINSAIEGRK